MASSEQGLETEGLPPAGPAGRPLRPLRLARFIGFPVLFLAVGYFIAMRAGWFFPRGGLLSAAVVLLCAWFFAEAVAAVVLRVRGRLGTYDAIARLALCGGLLAVFAGGLANHWLRLQGFVVMVEGDAAPFFHGQHLQEFDAGWLSDPKEMDLTLHLNKVEMRNVGGKAFIPVSKLVLARGGAEPHVFELSPGRAVADGPLRFHHGAFGYGARIVIVKGQEEIFDETVPFTTRRDQQAKAVNFVVEFNVAAHDLNVRAELALDSMDDRGRGHPRLAIAVKRGGTDLGSGMLRMGRFARLDEGHRVGFAGTVKWAEIDISRRNYPTPIFAGAGVAGAGLILLAAASLIRRVRA